MARLILLPPFGVARLGAADDPVVNYRLDILPSVPAGPTRRQLVPAETIFVDRATGRVREIRTARPDELTFKDASRTKIRPVAPFFEVWVQFDGEAEPRILTQGDLDAKGLSVTWDVALGNWKAFRRTGVVADQVNATLTGHPHTTGTPAAMLGVAANFLAGATLPLGEFQCILTDASHREIRARFLPPRGLIYGPPNTGDPAINVVLKPNTPWTKYLDRMQNGARPPAIPVRTFAGGELGAGRSRGLFDDTSEGIVTVHVRGGGLDLTARARIAVGPPDFAPDRLPIRTLADDFEWLEFGPDAPAPVNDAFVADLLEKAFDSAELLQVPRNKAESGWSRFPPAAPDFDPDQPREVHQELLAQARALTAGSQPAGILARRTAFVAKVRPAGSSEGGTKMPLFMVGQNRQPLFLGPRQQSTLKIWAGQAAAPPAPPPVTGPRPALSVPVDSARAQADMLALIRKKRDVENAAPRHRAVLVDGGPKRLSELFADDAALLQYLLTHNPVDNIPAGLEGLPLITRRSLEKSVFYQLIVRDDGPMNGRFTADELKVIERWIMSL
jgi:hypothetical protein